MRPLRFRRPASALLALLLAQAALGAQAVTGAVAGSVVDAKTGSALQKVQVIDQATGRSAITDALGRFELREVPAGAHRLFVTVVGYTLVQRDVEVQAGRTVDILIPLSEGTGAFTTNVTVTADLFRATQPTVAAQQTLGSADIQNLRGVLADDPLRAVQVLPGVATGDDLRSEFSVRGSDFSHMNLTVDGFSTPFLLHTVRAIEDRASTGSVAMINSDILDEVTLLNGSYAQRFGNRTGAEVDFRLREGSRERRQARIAVSGTNASMVAEGPLGAGRRGSWLTSVRQSYLDLIVHQLRDNNLQFGFTDAQAKFVYDPTSSQRVELTVLAGRSRLQELRNDLDTSDNQFVGRNASAIAIGSWRVTTPRWLLAARALGSLNTFANDTTSVIRLDDGHDRQAAGRIDSSLDVASGLQIEGGVSADWVDQARMRQRFNGSLGRYIVINDYQSQANRIGGYGQARWSAGALTVIPGGRVDHWSLTQQTTASPWLQAEWKVTASGAVRGGAGVYQQFPEFEQVIGSLGRRDARAERAEQYDLGFEQRLGASARWQVTLYDREEDGGFRRLAAETRLVSGRVVRGTTSAVYAQSLTAYARGVELLVQRKSPNGLAGWLSYSYGRNRYHDSITGESYWGDLDQRHTVNLYLFYRRSDRVSFSAKLRAGSNVPAPGYIRQEGADYFVSDTRNQVRLPVYSRADLRANRTFNWTRKRLTLFAEIMNVLNRENVRYTPPGVNSRTGQLSNLFESLIPIVPSAGILIEF